MFETIQKFWRQPSGGSREQQALAFLRVSLGLFFLYHGHHKLTHPGFARQLSDYLQHWAATHPWMPYREFLTQVAIPHVDIFSLLVTYGEIGVGISYILGFLVAYSAPAAVFMNLNFLLAMQHLGPAALGLNLVCILAHSTLFWARAGRYYGFDAYVFQDASPLADKPKAAFGKTPKKLKAVHEALAKAKTPSPAKNAKKSGAGVKKVPKAKTKPL